MSVHAHSIAAFRDLDAAARTAAILTVYRESTVPLSDREVMERLGFHDANAVRPRITELIVAKRVAEVGKIKDFTTGRIVRVCTNTRMT